MVNDVWIERLYPVLFNGYCALIITECMGLIALCFMSNNFAYPLFLKLQLVCMCGMKKELFSKEIYF